MKNIDNGTRKKLLLSMMRIRLLEEALADIYGQGEMRTPTHFSIGEEAVSAGVCARLKKTDAVFASHRCHAAYLAKGGDMRAMVSELFGKRTGALMGRSGSAHLSSPGDRMFSAPILGAMVPVAVGAALAFKARRKKDISVVFFGDAAVEEGVFGESVNFAVVKRLPVLFVCENNYFSTHTHIRYRQPDADISGRVRAFGISAVRVDGMDTVEVYRKSVECIERIRQRGTPFFLECVTYRYREHVGPLYDFNNPYRTKEDVMKWMARCPIKNLKNRLLESGGITERWLESAQTAIKKEITDALRAARRSGWPDKKDLLKYAGQ